MFSRGVALLTILAAAALLPGCRAISDRLWPGQDTASNSASAPAASAKIPHMPLGNPSGATPDASNPDNFLIAGNAYTLSYNNSRGTMNWVAWTTTAGDLGKSLERPDFRPDSRLPPGFTRVLPTDYSKSGYERGHMVPSADRFGKPDENAETFFMTNIVPQTADLNEFVWQKLETYSRSLVRRGFDLYTIAGVYGENGRIKGRVTVPTNCWKIIVVLPAGSGISEVGSGTRVIAVDVPDVGGIRGDNWRKYRTTVRSIERKTGNNFFDSLPQERQDALENRVDVR